ncbi:exonuclease domain-containing protein, partial [uncultured Eudoraea sp.]|uniref:exonuclease domain-containing protein n=1 Tax=uncultured Eudoraea sp. TaxID=1035614 RepID=UPI002624B3C6
IEKIRFVVFDTETTGLNSKNDKVLSIGAVSVTGNSIDISDSFEVYLNQEKFNKDDVVVVLFHDHGSRYVGKIYNDDWMKEQGFID